MSQLSLFDCDLSRIAGLMPARARGHAVGQLAIPDGEGRKAR